LLTKIGDACGTALSPAEHQLPYTNGRPTTVLQINTINLAGKWEVEGKLTVEMERTGLGKIRRRQSREATGLMNGIYLNHV